ncbi:MAG: hypothetical protein IT379_03970, partial [Deltaproteobacteria bacterium]|nr:hypothetical protein [Deltaproteobacteria bacterium]
MSAEDLGWERIKAVLWREWLEMRRNRMVLGQLVAMPIVLCVAVVGLNVMLA